MPASHFEDDAQRPGPWDTDPPPGRGPEHRERDERPPGREPVFNNGVWYVLLLVGVILGGYAIQSRAPLDPVANAFGFSLPALAAGRWWTLVTSMFVHGSWTHAVMNAAFLLAFGTPVARFLGRDLKGAGLFLGFLLVCGALSSLGYSALDPGNPATLIGISGAVSGLMAAAARLLAGRGVEIGPIRSRPVVALGVAWVGINLLVAVVGGLVVPGGGDALIAWQAHIAGFAVGLFAIAPFAWLARRE